VNFSDEERAELIAALSRTADMVAGLLDALDILRVALEAGRQPTDGDLQREGCANPDSSVVRTVPTRRCQRAEA
jgi:hypothetical protein